MSTESVLPVISIILSATALIVSLIVSLFRNRWMAKQMRLASAIAIINWLEEVRPQRQILYKLRQEQRQLAEWSEEEKEAADKVSRKFDILGILESSEYLDRQLVEQFYGLPAIELWQICRDWIEDQRSRRGPSHLAEFEKLAKRIRYAKIDTPAMVKAEDLARKPRSTAVGTDHPQ